MPKKLKAEKEAAAILQQKLEQADRDREAAIEAAKNAQKKELEEYWVGQFLVAQRLSRMGQHDLSFAEGFNVGLSKAGVSEEDPARAAMEIPPYEDVELDLDALEAKVKLAEQQDAEAGENADGMASPQQEE